MTRLPRALRAAAAAALLTLSALPAPAREDAREGYYYPEVTSRETFGRDIIKGPAADRAAREGFVTVLTRAQLDAPDTPPFAVFAKGEESRHLIIVALDDDYFRTLYRARAVMAQLTYNLRSTPFFREQGLQAEATFYDVLQLLGFEDLILSDGVSWTHRVAFER
jgi:hypothetical protein